MRIPTLADLLLGDGKTDWERLDRQRRWAATARSWAEKVSVSLEWAERRAGSEHERAMLRHEAERTFDEFVDAAALLVGSLGAESYEEAEKRVTRISARISDLRLAEKMERVEGRTPEEAEAFLRKAAELRGRS